MRTGPPASARLRKPQLPGKPSRSRSAPVAMPRTFPQRVTLGRPKQSALDILIGAAVIVALYSLIRVGRGATLTIVPGSTQISTRAINLPYDAARSLLRMFVALGASTAFSLGYGYAAAPQPPPGEGPAPAPRHPAVGA